MKIKLSALIIMVFISSFIFAADKSSKSVIAHLDPKQILLKCHDLNGPGPSAVMFELTHPNGKDLDWDVWPAITDLIAEGNLDWIKASGCLAHGARYGGCASCSTMLNIAWAEALTTNARAILELHKWIPIAEYACNLPFIEAEEDFLTDYMKTALANLEALATKPEDYTDLVQDARRSCTWNLKASYLDPNSCKFNGEEYVCPKVKQNCKFNGETYYDCKPQ